MATCGYTRLHFIEAGCFSCEMLGYEILTHSGGVTQLNDSWPAVAVQHVLQSLLTTNAEIRWERLYGRPRRTSYHRESLALTSHSNYCSHVVGLWYGVMWSPSQPCTARSETVWSCGQECRAAVDWTCRLPSHRLSLGLMNTCRLEAPQRDWWPFM